MQCTRFVKCYEYYFSKKEKRDEVRRIVVVCDFFMLKYLNLVLSFRELFLILLVITHLTQPKKKNSLDFLKKLKRWTHGAKLIENLIKFSLSFGFKYIYIYIYILALYPCDA